MNPIHGEKELLQLVAAGDETAYRQVFEQYWAKVYSITLLFAKVPELAEDVTQDVFAQVWMKREMLGEVNNFRPYLYTIAKHQVFNKLRTRVFTGDFSTYLQEYFADESADPSRQLEFKQAVGIIENGINQLTPQQQKVFRLSRFQNLSHAEIAEQTGLSKRTVKNYMVSAILSLRLYLQDHADISLVLFWMLLFL
jgi:RNA polymerase sigma-70 factor (ECF subfamily)